jgi:tetratricopeptide (TPR) repeat protein
MNRQVLLKYAMHPLTLTVLLAIAVAAMYGHTLHNPIVFDDLNFFDKASHPEYLARPFSFDFRWLPYASFEWTRALIGHDIAWYRTGNLILHAANAALLFFLLRRLFGAAMPQAEAQPARRPLAPLWMAFFGALIFAVHPATVYAAAYLIQRSILMATFLTLLMWTSFLHGAVRRNPWWLAGSALAYLLAVLSKEHAIAAPAVALAMLLMLRKLDKETIKRFWLVFVAYAAIAIYVLVLLKTGTRIIGEVYEPRGISLLAQMALRYPGFDPALAYPLSILTQTLLYFKYLLIWLLPNPAWMSADMFEPFAINFRSWPHLIGAAAFVSYGVGAGWLLCKRGRLGLLGFGLLAPWLMFLPEFSTVRIQESFVIYRSYLWMPAVFAILPVAFWRVPGKRTALLLSALVLVMLPLTWDRLATFATPLDLWNDAARLIVGKDSRPGVERIYHNRGLHLLKSGYPEMAVKDFDKAISLLPPYLLAINDRGAAYLTLKKYPEALADFNRAIALNPQFTRSYLGRALTYEGMGQPAAAMQDYANLCSQGFSYGCEKLQSPSTTTR